MRHTSCEVTSIAWQSMAGDGASCNAGHLNLMEENTNVVDAKYSISQTTDCQDKARWDMQADD